MKILPIVLIGLITGMASAQSPKDYLLPIIGDNAHIVPVHQSELSSIIQVGSSNGQTNVRTSGTSLPSSQAVLWSETFSSGFPAGWSTSGTPSLALWEYRGPLTTPNVSTGSQSSCVVGDPINSATPSDGFMIFDSGFLDNNQGPCSNFGSGPAPSPHTGILETGAINLLGTGPLTLSFYQYAFDANAIQSVNISNNGGSSWTTIWEAGLFPFQSTPNDDFVYLNITPWASNKADVRIQWVFSGDYYYWMIDDVSIQDALNSDLALLHQGYNTAQDTSAWSFYSQIPKNQADNDTVLFGGIVSNLGASNEANTLFDATVTGPVSFNDNLNLGTLLPGDVFFSGPTDPFLFNGGTGNYTIDFSTYSSNIESYPFDNIITDQVLVTDSVFAWDDDQLLYLSTIYSQNAEGLIFEISDPQEVSSITTWILENPGNGYSSVGSLVQFNVYQLGSGGINLVASSGTKTIGAADVNDFITWDLPNTVLQPGFYITSVNSISGPVYLVGGETPTAPYWHVVKNSIGQWDFDYGYAPVIRMNMDVDADTCTLAFDDLEIIQHETVPGLENGSAFFYISGGSGAYDWTFYDGLNTYPIPGVAGDTAEWNNFPPANYSVTITDSDGCTADTSFTILPYNPNNCVNLDLEVTVLNHETSPGANDGNVFFEIHNGTPMYTLVLSDGVNTATFPYITVDTSTFTGFAPGAYSLEVTDGFGCISNELFVIQPAVNPCPNYDVVVVIENHETSPGAEDGSVFVEVFNASIPLDFVVTNQMGVLDTFLNYAYDTATFIDIAPGTYSLMISDNNGCTEVETFTILGGGNPCVNFVSNMGTLTHETSAGANDGSVSYNLNGGSPAYVWSISDGQNPPIISSPSFSSSKTFSSLAPGIYYTTVTDNNGCMISDSVQILPACAMNLSVTIINESSAGATDGECIVGIAGAFAPYNYIWSTGASDLNTTDVSDTITGLTSGWVSVTITDTYACTEDTTVYIDFNTPCTGFMVNANPTDVSSSGATDGMVQTTLSLGTAPFVYLWNTGATTANITGVGTGTYVITVMDNNGCFAVDSAEVGAPCDVIITVTETLGTATAVTTGGTAPYTLEWFNSNGFYIGMGTQITGVVAGWYTVYVADANGCTNQDSVLMPTPCTLNVSITKTDVTAVGASNGTASAMATGGSGTYSYIWNNGATTSTINGLSAGVYTVTVNDGNGCTKTVSINIGTVGCQVNVVVSATNESASNTHDGTATAIPSGGASPYTYLWGNGATAASISGLSAGIHYVTVTDNNGCTAYGNAMVNAFFCNLSANLVVTNLSASNAMDASIAANVTTGTAPYTYVWSNGSTTQTISGLDIGTYGVTITDAAGCAYSGSAIVNPFGCNISIVMDGANSDFGLHNGWASANPLGSGISFTYVWSNTEITQTINGLSGNQLYVVTVTDDKGCSAIGDIYISNGPLSDFSTSVEGFEMVIYPNPAHESFIIQGQSASSGDINIEIYSSLGQLVVREKQIGQTLNQEFNVQNWKSGIYTIRVYNNQYSKMYKLLVK